MIALLMVGQTLTGILVKTTQLIGRRVTRISQCLQLMVTIVLIAWNADAEHRQVIIVKNALAKNETRKADIS